MYTHKSKWDSLSLKDKSEMMRAAVQSGIYSLDAIKQVYNEYAEGGPENNDNISLNNYLQQKRDSVVNAALSKSYGRNTPESIRFPVTSFEKIMYTEAMDRALRNASKYYDGSSPIDTYSTEYQKMSEHLNDASYYSDLLENGTYGFNCINTATNNYGDSHQTYSNQMFYDNPEIYGFSRINNGVMKPGDIVQQTKYGKPTHAVMYVKDNERGEPLYNYSSGKDTPQDLRKERRYHFGKEAPLIYRFVGNRQDIADWTKEYEYKYGKKKALGGPLVQLANKYAEGGDTEKEYYAGTLPEVEVVAPSSNRFVAQSSSTYVAPYISEVPEIRFVGSRYDRDTLIDKGGKPASDMTYEERWERQKKEKTRQDWKNLYEGLQKTVGTSIAGANLFTGGPWAAIRLSNGNKASTAGQLFSKYLLATNALDNYNDFVDLVVNPSISGAVDLATGLALSRYRDFGSRARQVGELVGQGFNAYNVADNYKALGGSLVERANRFAMGGPYKPGTYYGRPLEKGLEVVSPEFDVLMLGKTAANAAREAAGELINNGIQGTARQRAAITSRRFGRRMKESSQDFKDWSGILTKDVKTGNYADVPLDLRALAENVWETSRYIKNTPERYIENTLPRFYRGIFRRTYNNHMKPVVPVLFSDPEE